MGVGFANLQPNAAKIIYIRSNGGGGKNTIHPKNKFSIARARARGSL